MSKNMTMFNVKRQLATMKCIHTDYGNIGIADDVEILAAIEKPLARILTKRVNEAYESGETLDWLKSAYQEKTGKQLTETNSGDSLNGEVVLDNPRPSGDEVTTSKNVPKAPKEPKK